MSKYPVGVNVSVSDHLSVQVNFLSHNFSWDWLHVTSIIKPEVNRWVMTMRFHFDKDMRKSSYQVGAMWFKLCGLHIIENLHSMKNWGFWNPSDLANHDNEVK